MCDDDVYIDENWENRINKEFTEIVDDIHASGWGCRDCGEINKNYVNVAGRKVCALCSGTVLTLQEAFDTILEYKSFIRHSIDDGVIDYE